MRGVNSPPPLVLKVWRARQQRVYAGCWRRLWRRWPGGPSPSDPVGSFNLGFARVVAILATPSRACRPEIVWRRLHDGIHVSPYVSASTTSSSVISNIFLPYEKIKKYIFRSIYIYTLINVRALLRTRKVVRTTATRCSLGFRSRRFRRARLKIRRSWWLQRRWCRLNLY